MTMPILQMYFWTLKQLSTHTEFYKSLFRDEAFKSLFPFYLFFHLWGGGVMNVFTQV